jgi:hypothetical protein
MYYKKKYVKYKIKYFNLKKMLGGASNNQCDNIIASLKTKIKTLLEKVPNIQELPTNIDTQIDAWFNGIYDDKSILMTLLDSNEPSITKPLWWSGFNVSCDEGKKILNAHKQEVSGYTDTDSELSQCSEYTKLRNECSQDASLGNFEAILSTYFTLNGLTKLNSNTTTPIRLRVLLNKSIDITDLKRLQNSYFYITELNIILDYCITPLEI